MDLHVLRPGRGLLQVPSGFRGERSEPRSRDARAGGGGIRLGPMMTPPLYAALAARYGPLPPDEEKEWMRGPQDVPSPAPPISAIWGAVSWISAGIEHWTCFHCGHINAPSHRACEK